MAESISGGRRDRILATARGAASGVPFFHWWRHAQIGWAEREARNRGMGLNWMRPPYVERRHGVTVTERQLVVDGLSVIRRTYETPVGSVYEDEHREPGTFQWHANRSWRDVTPWLIARLIKGPDDYPVVKYIVEHTEYVADYFPVEQALDWLGDEGVVCDALPHSPLQMLLIDWIGSEEGRCFYHLADYPDLVEDLYRALSKSREPLYDIAARSPAPVTLWGDNVDGQLVVPRLFERYFLPEYEKQARLLRARGKLFAVHMDGRLGVLRDLIARSPVDVVEAFHPPPMGDLPLGDALEAWPGKAIWVGFPGGIYELGPGATTELAHTLAREAAGSGRVAVAASTENIVSNENLLALTAVLERYQL